MKIKTYTTDNEEIKIPVAQSYKDCFTLIKSDYYRRKGRIASIPHIFFNSFSRPTMRFCFWFRLAQYKKGWFYPFARLMHHRFKKSYGLFIPAKTLIGYGFYIQHATPVIINPNAIIGNNVTISQFTTIGSNVGKAAIIGDNVYIEPSVQIVDDIEIGDNVTIGAGATVTKNARKGTTIAGVPAKIINQNSHPEYIRNPYPIKF